MARPMYKTNTLVLQHFKTILIYGPLLTFKLLQTVQIFAREKVVKILEKVWESLGILSLILSMNPVK